MNVRFLIEAEQDVDEAFAWYEEQVIGLGYDFLDELDQAVRLICSYPDGFMRIDADLKHCYMKRFPFSIVYGYYPFDDEKVVSLLGQVRCRISDGLLAQFLHALKVEFVHNSNRIGFNRADADTELTGHFVIG